MSTAYQLVDNFDDFGCYLHLRPMPPVKLSAFFAERAREGPFSILNFIGKPRELEKHVESIFAAWEAEAAAINARVRPTEEVIAVLNEHKKDKASQHMTKARAMAARAMQAKKAKRTIQLDAK